MDLAWISGRVPADAVVHWFGAIWHRLTTCICFETQPDRRPGNSDDEVLKQLRRRRFFRRRCLRGSPSLSVCPVR